MNKVILIGRTGGEVELITASSGNQIGKVSLATTERWMDRNGEKQERTDWHRLNFFGKLAETASKYLRKGDVVYIEGRLQYSQVEKDGTKITYTNITVDRMELLPNSRQAETPANPPRREPVAPSWDEQPVLSEEADEDLPF